MLRFKKSKSFFYIILSFVFVILTFTSVDAISKKDIQRSSDGASNKKTVYLTVDDGPIPVITDKMLDVLKKHNVKATFFVVGKEIDGREDILKRIYAEGHSIGLHTYSHSFKKIYSSEDNFIDEMLKAQDKIKDIIGYSPNIIRFPGGSAGHLNKNFLDKLHKHNLKVYDWNVDLHDGVNPHLSVDQLLSNSKKVKDDCCDLILLMHCNSNNKNTVKALPYIINYYKNLGYEFKPISTNTTEYYYRFKN